VIQSVPVHCLRADGIYVETRASFHPQGSDGQPGVFILFGGNELVAAKQDEQKRLERYRSLFNNSLEGIFLTTPDGRYLDVNPTLA